MTDVFGKTPNSRYNDKNNESRTSTLLWWSRMDLACVRVDRPVPGGGGGGFGGGVV